MLKRDSAMYSDSRWTCVSCYFCKELHCFVVFFLPYIETKKMWINRGEVENHINKICITILLYRRVLLPHINIEMCCECGTISIVGWREIVWSELIYKSSAWVCAFKTLLWEFAARAMASSRVSIHTQCIFWLLFIWIHYVFFFFLHFIRQNSGSFVRANTRHFFLLFSLFMARCFSILHRFHGVGSLYLLRSVRFHRRSSFLHMLIIIACRDIVLLFSIWFFVVKHYNSSGISSSVGAQINFITYLLCLMPQRSILQQIRKICTFTYSLFGNTHTMYLSIIYMSSTHDDMRLFYEVSWRIFNEHKENWTEKKTVCSC